MSTSRLELRAPILGLHLTLSILSALNISITKAYFWSDGMNVLCWIRGKEKKFRSFVAKRTVEIQSQTKPEQWQYVATKENPADLCSRGLKVRCLMESHLWWNGPDYLLQHESEWPKTKEVKSEAKKAFLASKPLHFPPVPGNSDPLWRLNPSSWSSWSRLTRITSWVFRFVDNCRLRLDDHQNGPFLLEISRMLKCTLSGMLSEQSLPKKSVRSKTRNLFRRGAV